MKENIRNKTMASLDLLESQVKNKVKMSRREFSENVKAIKSYMDMTLAEYTADEKKEAISNMKEMGIYELKDRSYRELSGGQQQRVLLARALCATRKMLLLDEPVAGLDPYVTEEMYQVIKSLNDKGITIIMISHDINAAIKYATHILHIGHEIIFAKKDDYVNMDNKQVFHVNV